ncbi:putative HTH-type transcriptional regulator YusO [Frondihabitans sp. 762G35]|uniref:MarR family winged helix-turn-helix transcriptional regulator n=1 Tax=Frondihabitans sp. 762G35 TaxID=1446794 RepID=UPI000D21DBC4|nr:MarR family transcriptional regulator [Frondihabitans sp. 762G35]ARC56707.1 putative HTH-type transcriptional regulator YusO [Frondihabitans sp. 762G35]
MDDTRWLTDDERRAWVRFAAVLELLPGVLDSQLDRDEGITHFEYFVLAMLSETPGRTLRMTHLASRTNATLPRLSRVVSRLEGQGFVERSPCVEDRRATNATLTDAGWRKVVHAAPGHVENVRGAVIDVLTQEQVAQLDDISAALLARLDPESRLFANTPPPGTAAS